jgi:hypothetical protein
VKVGYKVVHGDSYMTFESWSVTRLSRALYACDSGVLEALD